MTHPLLTEADAELVRLEELSESLAGDLDRCRAENKSLRADNDALLVALAECQEAQQPPTKLLVGAAVQGGTYTTLEAFEATLGATVPVYRNFGGGQAPSAAGVATYVTPSKGKRTVVLSFVADVKNPSASIAGCRAAADALEAHGELVYVALNHEPQVKINAGTYTADEWLRMQELLLPYFAAVPNVAAGIIHTADNFKTGQANALIPKTPFVWVGADGYGWDNKAATIESLFLPALTKAQGLGVKLIVAENGFVLTGPKGAVETPQSRANKITDGAAWCRSKPDIVAYLYFDTNDAGKGYDWRIDKDPASLAAFKAEVVR